MPPQNVGSDGITTTTSSSSSSLRSLSSFLRRHLLCGSSWKPPPRRCLSPLPLPLPSESPPPPPPPKSDKLLHLLHLAEIHERQEIDEAARRKVDSLQRLKDVVRDYLQCVDEDDELSKGKKKKEGAVRVRLLSKEDAEARGFLAMLGAIPPLVSMIDSDEDDDEAKINALYALLNLGIGNDA